MHTSSDIANILIIKPGAIGDLLQMTPVVRILHKRYPSARISMLVGSQATAELFRYNALVHETIIFEKKGSHRSFRSLTKLWKTLHRNKYDLIINFQRSNMKTWLLASAAFPCRLLVYHKARSRRIHAVVNYLETLAPLDIDGETANQSLELFPGVENQAFADRLLSQLGQAGGPLIALNPGASHRVNRWGIDRFAALADRLALELSATVIIIGGEEDILLADEILALTSSNPVNMAGKANLLQTGALLERCSVLVSGDTGPLHLATAVGTPVVALFGAADPARTGPLGKGHRVIQAEGVPCVPCSSRRCANSVYLACMEKITVNSVFETIRSMIKSG